MVELMEMRDDNVATSKHWRILVQGSWLGTATYMKDQHLGIRIYEDVVVAPSMLKQIADAVEKFENSLQENDTLPMFPTPPGEMGN